MDLFKENKPPLPEIWCGGKEKGTALIITFFVMTIMLSIVLGIAAILFIEIKMIRGLGNSVVAFYAADSGIEKTLYYDRKVLTGGRLRGLCDIPNTCSDCQIRKFDGNDCGVDTCTDCDIYFSTEFGGKKYEVKAEIRPSEQTTVTSIKSFGTYQGTTRAIELVFSGVAMSGMAPQAPMIYNAKVKPITGPLGTNIVISADITDPDGVDSQTTKAHIQDIQKPDIDIATPLLEYGIDPDDPNNLNYYSGTWTGSEEGAYYVDIHACDTKGNCSWVENITP
jgi:hypothetical protein